MKRMLVSSLAILTAGAIAASPAAAQTRASFMLGGGLTVPLGDFGDAAKLGWHGLGGVEFGFPTLPVGIRVDGIYGQHKFENNPFTDGKFKLFGANADVVWHSKTPGVQFYVLGGPGIYNVKADPDVGSGTDETKFALNGGAGIRFGTSMARFFAEGRYVNVFTSGSDAHFIPLTVGVQFGGGQ